MLAAALLHACWNALAKGRVGGDPFIGAVVIAIGAAVVSLATLPFSGLPDPASYPFVGASGIIHVGYFVLIGASYRHADFTAIYPLMRGAAPLVVAAFGLLLFQEALTLPLLAGTLFLSGGVIGLGAQSIRSGGLAAKGLAIAAVNIAIIVIYTLVDGYGVRRSGNPVGYVTLMMALTGAILVGLIGCYRGRDLLRMLLRQWHIGLVGGVMAMLSYGAALWAMTHAPIGAVAALRETSVLFATMIGVVFLGERLGLARLVATLAIFAGLACMRLS
ncbi:MAG: EamA family transporter [Hyphomicrobiaceae bacterium]|nr:EamA family transporter [Hyphomicrobiaceae bacterium]